MAESFIPPVFQSLTQRKGLTQSLKVLSEEDLREF